MWRFLSIILVSCALTMPVTTPASASDQDRARSAVQAGEALPLGQILKRVRRSHSGRLLDADLRQGRGGWVYELRILKPNGRVLTLIVNARNGQVLGAR
jgi:uncharacterized membrane protein YkoI